MATHMLIDPGTFVTSHLCQNHKKLLEKFCKTDRTPVCMKCTEREHKHHEIVPMETESRKIRVRKTVSKDLLLFFTLRVYKKFFMSTLFMLLYNFCLSEFS